MSKQTKATDVLIDRANRSLAAMRGRLLVERDVGKLREIHANIAAITIRLDRLRVEAANENR